MQIAIRPASAATDKDGNRVTPGDGTAVLSPHIEGEVRRGLDDVKVTVSVTVSAADVGQALTAAWRGFRKAASDDLSGWDLASVTAGVRREPNR